MKINILTLLSVFITLFSCTKNKEQDKKASEKRRIEITDSVYESKSNSKNSKSTTDVSEEGSSIKNSLNTLFFSDGSVKYQIEINNSKITIIYQYMNYEKMKPEYAQLINKRIVVPKDRISYDGQKTDEIYKIEGRKLCVYNPETDLYDYYDFQPNKSSCSLNLLF